MESDTIRAITTLSAVVLGFLLSQLSEYFRRRRETKKQKENVRHLVQKEVRQNIELIRDFWTLIIDRLEDANSEKGAGQTSTLAKILGRSPLPHLSIHVWNSNLNEIPRTFSKDEIDRLWKFYQLLLEIEQRKVFFDKANESRVQSIQHARATRGAASGFISEQGFWEQIKQHVSVFESMINEIISFEAVKV